MDAARRNFSRMGLAAATRPRLSEAEYLALERAAEFRSEYHDGEVFAMAGGTPEHSLIATNLLRELGNRLRGRPCRVYNADLRLKIEAGGLYTYPDASVICGPVITPPGADDVALNPTLVAEVLSPATEAYDRGQKFGFYRRLASLKEYLLVSQRAARVELFSLDAQGGWRLSEASGPGAALAIPALGIQLSLAEVFAGIEFGVMRLRPDTNRAA